MADGADSGRLGLGFGGDAGSRVATAGAVRTDAVFGDGVAITTSSTASGSAAKTTHGGPGRNPAVATKTMNQAVCNRTDIIIATMSSDTGHERVAVTVPARSASFDVARGAESVGCGLSAVGTSPASWCADARFEVGPAVSRRRRRSICATRRSSKPIGAPQ